MLSRRAEAQRRGVDRSSMLGHRLFRVKINLSHLPDAAMGRCYEARPDPFLPRWQRLLRVDGYGGGRWLLWERGSGQDLDVGVECGVSDRERALAPTGGAKRRWGSGGEAGVEHRQTRGQLGGAADDDVAVAAEEMG